QRAAQATKSGPPHRTAPQPHAPLGIGEPREIHDAGSNVALARLPGRVRTDRRLRIPRTDVLTDVAAVDLRVHGRPKRLFDHRTRLDGQVRQAAPGVDSPGVGDRAGRARLDAARARA